MATKEQEIELAERIKEAVNHLNSLTNSAMESGISVQVSMTTREDISGARVPAFRLEGIWSSLLAPTILLPK